MKVFHLPRNIASQMSITVRALNDIGIQARGIALNTPHLCDNAGIVNYRRLPLRPYPFRAIASRLRWFNAVLRGISWADVIHWHFGCATLPWDLDLQCAASLHKPRAVEFFGSDLRTPNIASSDNAYAAQLYRSKAAKPTYDRGRFGDAQDIFSLHGFACIVSGGEMRSYVQDHLFSSVSIVRARIPLLDYTPSYPNALKSRPLVVHAPSHEATKGTNYVLSAINQLEKTHSFEFKLLSGVPRRQVLQAIQACDVFLDQFVLGEYGVATLEAMAYGKPTLCYIKPSILHTFPVELPIVNASPDNLEEVLREILQDGYRRHEIGRKSRAYVENYHDAHKIARELVEIYEQLLRRNARIS